MSGWSHVNIMHIICRTVVAKFYILLNVDASKHIDVCQDIDLISISVVLFVETTLGRCLKPLDISKPSPWYLCPLFSLSYRNWISHDTAQDKTCPWCLPPEDRLQTVCLLCAFFFVDLSMWSLKIQYVFDRCCLLRLLILILCFTDRT